MGRTCGSHDHAGDRAWRFHQVPDSPRAPPQPILAHMPTEHPCDAKCRSTRRGDRRRQRDEHQQRQDVAGEERQRNALAVLERLPPLQKGRRYDRHVVDDADHRQRAATAGSATGRRQVHGQDRRRRRRSASTTQTSLSVSSGSSQQLRGLPAHDPALAARRLTAEERFANLR
jgi:hypothetical protein